MSSSISMIMEAVSYIGMVIPVKRKEIHTKIQGENPLDVVSVWYREGGAPTRRSWSSDMKGNAREDNLAGCGRAPDCAIQTPHKSQYPSLPPLLRTVSRKGVDR